MANVNMKYLKDESGNKISPITSVDSVYVGSTPIGGGIVPIGTILLFACKTAPSNYLLCDGATYNVSDYSELAHLLGTQFGTVSSTQFSVPDLRGRVPIGYDSSGEHNYLGIAEELGRKYGEYTHKLTINEMPSHRHSLGTANGQGNNEWGYNFTYDNNTAAWNGGSCSYTGGSEAHNNIQPSICVNYIIRAK